MIKLDIKPDSYTIISAIKTNNIAAFDNCVNDQCVPLDIEHLNLVLGNDYLNLDFLKTILWHKITPTRESFLIFINKYCGIGVIELMIKNGLEINKDDIELLISKNIKITNWERFGVDDNQIYFWSYINNNFLYLKELKIDKKILLLRDKCRNK
jgi:hypothetical protein